MCLQVVTTVVVDNKVVRVNGILWGKSTRKYQPTWVVDEITIRSAEWVDVETNRTTRNFGLLRTSSSNRLILRAYIYLKQICHLVAEILGRRNPTEFDLLTRKIRFLASSSSSVPLLARSLHTHHLVVGAFEMLQVGRQAGPARVHVLRRANIYGDGFFFY